MKLFANLNSYGKNIALISNDLGNVTYKDLYNEYEIIKKKLLSKSLVFLLTENSIASIIHYISLLKNENKIFLLDARIKKNDFNDLIKRFKPSYIILHKKSLLKKIGNYEFLCSRYNHDILIIKSNKIIQIDNDLALLISTSGTMGNSKFAMLSRTNLKENSKSIIKYLDIKNDDRTLTTMPISYSYMISIINTYIEKGASIFITNKSLIDKNFWNDYKKNKITSFSGVPYIFEILIKIGMDRIYSKYLKCITQAGGKLSIENTKQIYLFSKKKDIKFFIMYGQTEASPRISYLHLNKFPKKIGSVGKALDKVKIQLIDKKKQLIFEKNKIGEIIVKGKNVFMGYATRYKDLLKKNKSLSTLRTGDLGYFDDDKFLYITGRSIRLAKIHGNRISLDDLEKNMKLKGFQILSKDDKNLINIYFKNKKYSSKKILKNLVDITNFHHSVFRINFIDHFPRTNSGKIDYSII